ncbi:cobalamin-5'-phosphate synthase [Sulfitobacter brevis]|uniref:Adenosylcobinamide-GDP ribazoletransferase n=1 Tax=Sulfitobacter brevis TaxID=74348 RepID=A0A1I1SQF5_9RHOB|nr:adenosylcobinamide-GDP ribazoletransferase [Sulfitobacter brevis]SFD46113.1 cobalamin-5'-phosphate synthase [Sulfitobacter brevis]
MIDRSDISRLAAAYRPQDLLTALGLLTRLPLPVDTNTSPDGRAMAAAAWAYPVAGFAVGLVAVAFGSVLAALSVAPPVAALFVMATMILLTGAMHEDGLADCADGFWGGWDRDRRLEIMKDSQIGTYGVIGLALSLGLRWMVLTLLIEQGALGIGLLGAAVISRAAMVWVMYHLPNARAVGLSRLTGRPDQAATGGAIVLAVLISLWVAGLGFFWLLAIAAAVAFGSAQIARRKIGGQTGDVLGAIQQLVDLAVLVTLTTMIG